ncbi:sulfur carrier protein ThiS [Reinekea forsetii]|nr:sulfur carrier protein ThiS [Reinekea forsetii]
MQLTLNGNPKTIEHQFLSELIEHAKFQSPFAVAVNHQFVPKQHYQTTKLNEGDRIDVVSPIQGG